MPPMFRLFPRSTPCIRLSPYTAFHQIVTFHCSHFTKQSSKSSRRYLLSTRISYRNPFAIPIQNRLPAHGNHPLSESNLTINQSIQQALHTTPTSVRTTSVSAAKSIPAPNPSHPDTHRRTKTAHPAVWYPKTPNTSNRLLLHRRASPHLVSPTS